MKGMGRFLPFTLFIIGTAARLKAQSRSRSSGSLATAAAFFIIEMRRSISASSAPSRSASSAPLAPLGSIGFTEGSASLASFMNDSSMNSIAEGCAGCRPDIASASSDISLSIIMTDALLLGSGASRSFASVTTARVPSEPIISFTRSGVPRPAAPATLYPLEVLLTLGAYFSMFRAFSLKRSESAADIGSMLGSGPSRTILPSDMTTSSSSHQSETLPYFTECGPPELPAIMPPIVQ